MKLLAHFLSVITEAWRRLLSPLVTPCTHSLLLHLVAEPLGFPGHIGAQQETILISLTGGLVITSEPTDDPKRD